MLSRTSLAVLILCSVWALDNAYHPMVFEIFNSCHLPLFQIKALISEKGCRKMSGFYLRYENPPYCEVQICKVPRKGEIANKNVWGVGTIASVQNANDEDKVAINWRTSRADCERLTGKPILKKDKNVSCVLTLVRQTDPRMAKLTGILPFAGKGECPSKAGSVEMGTTGFAKDDCEIIGGVFESSKCNLDLCYTEAIQCIPTDGWNHVQMCVNDASEPIKCTVAFEEGLTNTEGKSSSEEKAVGASVSTEVSADIMGLFSTTVSATVSGDFSWAQEVSNEATWSESTTHTMEVTVKPNRTMTIQQLVGICGSIRVKTRNLRALESKNP